MMKKIYDRLRRYSTFADRTGAAYARLKELADNPDYSTDPTFVTRFLDARERLRRSASTECIWRRMYELDRYACALTIFEHRLEELHAEKPRPSM